MMPDKEVIQKAMDAKIYGGPYCAHTGVNRRMIDAMDKRRFVLQADYATLRALVVEMARVLAALKRGGYAPCWCEMAIGNPMYRDHTDKCKGASAILAALPEEVTRDDATR